MPVEGKGLLALIFLLAWAFTILGFVALIIYPLLGRAGWPSLETSAYYALWIVFTLIVTAGLAPGAGRPAAVDPTNEAQQPPKE